LLEKLGARWIEHGVGEALLRFKKAAEAAPVKNPAQA
jgi:hypothetical protein